MTTALMARLVDDAGLFPPTSLSMPDAVARHRRDLAERSPVLTHRFLCPASRIEGFRAQLRDDDRIAVGLIADDGPAELAAVVAGITDDDALDLAAVEFPLARTGQPDPAAALDTAMTVVADAKVPDGVPLFVEPSAVSEAEVLAPAVARRAEGRVVGVKLRCGGMRADLFPSPETLAAALVVAVRAGVVVKATAGLHHAIRYTDPGTGFTHHGFLNLLLAVADAVAGADPATVAATLRAIDSGELADRASSLGPEAMAATRGVLNSYGSCSTSTPVAEARELGLTP